MATGSITSASQTLTYKTTLPTTGTQPADGVEVGYTLTNFRTRAKITEVHVIPTVDTIFRFKIYENSSMTKADLIYDIETTTTGDEVHDIINPGLGYNDEAANNQLYIGIINKSGGTASAFNIKIKYTPEE